MTIFMVISKSQLKCFEANLTMHVKLLVVLAVVDTVCRTLVPEEMLTRQRTSPKSVNKILNKLAIVAARCKNTVLAWLLKFQLL